MSEGVEAVGFLKNISKAGVFIRGSDLPRQGVPIALGFQTPAGSSINLRGEVRWNTEKLRNPDVPSGFGVLLREPSAGYREFFLWALEQDEKPE